MPPRPLHLQKGGTEPCTKTGRTSLSMASLSLVIKGACEPSHREHFKILFVGVAGKYGEWNCERAFLKRVKSLGFVFKEVGVMDSEEVMQGSGPGMTQKTADEMSVFMAETFQQDVPAVVSVYVGRLNDDFMVQSGRTSKFDLCVYSSGQMQALTSVRGPNCAADLGLVIHSCFDYNHFQAYSYFFLPFDVHSDYSPVKVEEVPSCGWIWSSLMLLLSGAKDAVYSKNVFLGAPSDRGSGEFFTASILLPPIPPKQPPDDFDCRGYSEDMIMQREEPERYWRLYPPSRMVFEKLVRLYPELAAKLNPELAAEITQQQQGGRERGRRGRPSGGG